MYIHITCIGRLREGVGEALPVARRPHSGQGA